MLETSTKRYATAQVHQDQLPRLKKAVENAHDYMQRNYENYHSERKFIYDSSLSTEDINLLKELMKPQIEANTLEAFISRLLGEFAKQEPSIEVSASPGAQIHPQVIDVVEGHVRSILFDANNDSFEQEVYKETLSGGFSAMKVWTDYESDKSFDQCIKVGKPRDVTLVGHDPLARLPHKGDGRFSFELYPKTKQEFKDENPKIDIEEVEFTRSLANFNWSFSNKDEDILLICDFYEKKPKKTKIYKMADNRVLNEEEYEEEQQQWTEAIQKGFTLKQPPEVIDTRMADTMMICRYRFIENQVIEYKETDFVSLPIPFVDGNSVMLKGGSTGGLQQKTRSYIHHARDIQRMKNMSFQTLANELENLVQHKWIMPVEAIPEEYSDAYTNNQLPNVVLYKMFKDNQSDVPLTPPREVQRTPIPPEVSNTISLTDQLNQLVLGTFDSSQGINTSQLSGKAVIASTTNSNAAAMPYIMGFLNGLNQVAQIILEMIPKYYKTPRTIPIMTKEGKRSYQEINRLDGSGVQLNYDSSALQVRVKAGVNFSVQKQQSLQMMTQLSSAVPLIGQFLAQEGLDVMLDNMEFRGADTLKSRAPAFMAQLKKQQAQAQQGPPPNPMVQIKQQELAQNAQQKQVDAQLKQQQMGIDQQNADTQRIKVLTDAQDDQRQTGMQGVKAVAEITRANDQMHLDHAVKAHDQVLKHVDLEHRHVKDTVQLAHQLTQPQETNTNASSS